MARTAKFGVVIEGTDQTAKATKSAAKGIKDVKGKAGDLGKTVSSMPDKFTKASGAMMGLGGAASQMGGGVAAGAGKLAEVASIAATGGPLGIALAAATVGVLAMSAAWDAMGAPLEAARAGLTAISRALDSSEARMQQRIDKTRELTKATADFGKTSTQVLIDDTKKALPIIAEEIKAEEARIVVLQRLIATNEQASESNATLLRSTIDFFVEGASTAVDVSGQDDVNRVLLEQALLRKKNAESIRATRIEEAKAAKVFAESEKARAIADKAQARRTSARAARAADIKRETSAIAALSNRVQDFGKTATEAALDQIDRQIVLIDHGQKLNKIEQENVDILEKKAQLLTDLLGKENAAKDAALAKAAADKQAAESKRGADAAAKAQEAAAAASAASWKASAQSAGQSIGEIVGQAITASKTTEEVMIGMLQTLVSKVVSAAASTILANALTAGAGAASSQAPIPVVGPALAAGALSAMVALVTGLMSALPKAATGGLITGGVPGVDSVPILAQAGELIIPKGKVQDIQRGQQGQQQGGNTTIINRTWMPNRIEEIRMSRRQIKSRQRLSQQRMLPVGA